MSDSPDLSRRNDSAASREAAEEKVDGRIVGAGGVLGRVGRRRGDLLKAWSSVPYRVQTGGMAPAVYKGEIVLVEGFTFKVRKPSLGDIVVFTTEGAGGINPAIATDNYKHIKRIAGCPGNLVGIQGGRLCVNDVPLIMTNRAGEIHYVYLTGQNFPRWEFDTFTVPEGQYFMLGDNSPQSADSRFWGCVPAENIRGRVAFRK